MFFYFAKGARIDAAIELTGTSRSPRESFLKPDAKPIVGEAQNVYDREAFLTRWELKSSGKLIIKNNSKNFAYNILLVNAKEIFTEFPVLKKLTSIAPNEQIVYDINFIYHVIEETGPQADAHPRIPKRVENRILKIQYENEAGTKFFTNSFIDFDVVYNEYTTS